MDPLEHLAKRYKGVQLATLADAAPEGDEWVHEVKFDGYRLLGFAADGKVRLRTRNGNDWTDKFPAIAKAMAALRVREAVVDMEAVVLDESGRSSFQALQGAMGTAGIIAYAFDLLALNGEDLRGLPLLERKERLRRLLKGEVLRYSDHFAGHGGKMLKASCKAGLEGIISKDASAHYGQGRGRSWLKIKCGRRQEFVILGYSLARSGGRSLGALYLGYYKRGKMQYAGKVGTGFSMQGAEELVKKFTQGEAVLERDELPAAEWKAIRWVKPELVCEVAFTEWTSDGRARHPSFQGLREDKDARDVKRE
ncbi:MAG: hypothetical protein HYX27_27575 [Acidobacteria bacterium]|nr:hypothetical protein [Acidobacteriota bacterium]